MHILKLDDAIRSAQEPDAYFWELGEHHLRFHAYIAMSNITAGVQTYFELDGQSVWSSPGEPKIREVWTDISVALLAYDILCEPLTSDILEYGVDGMVSPD